MQRCRAWIVWGTLVTSLLIYHHTTSHSLNHDILEARTVTYSSFHPLPCLALGLVHGRPSDISRENKPFEKTLYCQLLPSDSSHMVSLNQSSLLWWFRSPACRDPVNGWLLSTLGFLNFSIADIWGWVSLCRGAACVLQDGEQHPWHLPIR